MNQCGRCGLVDRDVRMSLVNLAREARQLGLRHEGPEYHHDYRCRDRDACLSRVKATLERGVS